MSSSTGTPDGEPVYLHVYDLSMGMAASMSAAFLGVSLPYIPHTGIVAWQHEFFYSGGISVLKPHVVVQTFGLAPIQKVLLGHTRKGEQELRVFLRSISHRFTADKYDLFRHNCNNFTAEVAKFLFGDAVPTSYPSIILEVSKGSSPSPSPPAGPSRPAPRLGALRIRSSLVLLFLFSLFPSSSFLVSFLRLSRSPTSSSRRPWEPRSVKCSRRTTLSRP